MASFLQNMDKFNSVRMRDLKSMISQQILPRYKHRKFPETFQIVEIGSLTGASSALLARKFPGSRVLGVEADEDMVNFAQRAHPKINYVQADIGERNFVECIKQKLGEKFQLPFADLVVSVHILQVNDPNRDTILKNIQAILKPNGYLYATFSFWTALLKLGREIADTILAQSSTEIFKHPCNPWMASEPCWMEQIPEIKRALCSYRFGTEPEIVYVTSKIRLNTLRQFQDCIRFIYPLTASLPEAKRLPFFSRLFDQIYDEYMERENMKGFTYQYLFVSALLLDKK